MIFRKKYKTLMIECDHSIMYNILHRLGKYNTDKVYLDLVNSELGKQSMISIKVPNVRTTDLKKLKEEVKSSNIKCIVHD